MKNLVFKKRRERGFTLVEVMMASIISAGLGLTVASVMLVSAVAIKEVFAEARTRSTRMIAIDQARYRLAQAQIGSFVISDSNHRIQYTNPGLGGVTSAFRFDADTLELFYDEDISDGNAAILVAEGPIDFTFELDASGAIVLLNVRSAADVAFGDIDTEEGETAVFVRNS